MQLFLDVLYIFRVLKRNENYTLKSLSAEMCLVIEKFEEYVDNVNAFVNS